MYTPFAHAFAYAINKTSYVILYWFSVKITLCMLYSVVKVYLWNDQVFFNIHSLFCCHWPEKEIKHSNQVGGLITPEIFILKENNPHLNSVKSFLNCSKHFCRNCWMELPFFI